MHADPTLMGSSKVFRCAHWGGPGGSGERETISGMCGEDLCCLCVLLFSNTTPLVSKPTTSLYPWNNPGLGMVFLHYHMNRLPVTSEGLCDKNKGNLISYTWTHSLTAPHLKLHLQILTSVWISTWWWLGHPSDASALVTGTPSDHSVFWTRLLAPSVCWINLTHKVLSKILTISFG